MIQSRTPIHVAYADDHEVIRKGVRELLTASGAIQFVIDVSNGEELIEKLSTAEELPDVCLLDIFMPKLDGHGALLAIKARWPQLRVLVLTGHNTEYFLIKMIRAGASGYLLKNCAPRELENAIIAIHENGYYFSEGVDAKLALRAARLKVDVPELSEIEVDLLRHCCSDMSYVQIAEKLGMTPKSIEHWREGLFRKLHVTNRSGLVLMAVQLGLVEVQHNTVYAT